MPSTIQRVIAAAWRLTEATIAPRAAARPSCAAATPRPRPRWRCGSREQDRGPEEDDERPEHGVPVHRRHLTRRLVSVAVTDRPVLAGVLGALVIAFSGILVRLAEVSPSTAAFFRCAYALPCSPCSPGSRTAATAGGRCRAGAALGRGTHVRRRPHVLAPLDRGGGRRAGHRARQHPGRLRGAAAWVALGAARQPRAGLDPGRVRRRRPDLGRGRQRARTATIR